MSEPFIPQILELADGLKCVRLEDFLREHDELRENNQIMAKNAMFWNQEAEKARRERDEAREAYEIISSKWQKTDEQLAKTLRERDGALRQCTNFEEIIRGEWPKDQAEELIRYAKEGAK